ncbi:T9SS type A sorting domain-containing protein, partial [candidate division WOR-3 bacterium]|nr:T9SS type A sorting domain-containing protein [candidate division WOR-3 bacterium]
ISFGTGQSAKSIVLKIYDVNGRMVKDFSLPTAYSLLHTEVSWDGVDNMGQKLPSGVYFVRFTAGGLTKTQKIILLK